LAKNSRRTWPLLVTAILEGLYFNIASVNDPKPQGKAMTQAAKIG